MYASAMRHVWVIQASALSVLKLDDNEYEFWCLLHIQTLLSVWIRGLPTGNSLFGHLAATRAKMLEIVKQLQTGQIMLYRVHQ